MSEMRRPGGKLASRPLHFFQTVLVQCMAIKLELLTVPSEK